MTEKKYYFCVISFTNSKPFVGYTNEEGIRDVANGIAGWIKEIAIMKERFGEFWVFAMPSSFFVAVIVSLEKKEDLLIRFDQNGFWVLITEYSDPLLKEIAAVFHKAITKNGWELTKKFQYGEFLGES